MDLSATTPFDLVILDTATSCFKRKKKKDQHSSTTNTVTNELFAFVTTNSSASEGFSSTSSNGSYGTSPTPIPMQQQQASKSSNLGSAEPPKRGVRSYTHQSTLQKSASEMNVKQLGQRDSEFWLRVVPSCKIRPRECDEVPEEFKRAGIGLCFGGEKIQIVLISDVRFAIEIDYWSKSILRCRLIEIEKMAIFESFASLKCLVTLTTFVYLQFEST